MSYFGSIYFKMPNGLVAGLRNVFDDGKIVKGSNMQFDRQARLSFIPLKNIKKVHVIGDNHTTLTNEEYKKEKIDDILCSDIKAYMKPKRNATIIETYDNKLWCWGNGDYIGYSYSQNNSHVNQFLDEPQEVKNIKYNDIKRICVSKRTSNIFNGTFIITKNGRLLISGYGNIGEGYKYYYNFKDITYNRINGDLVFNGIDNIFVTRDCLFILYKGGYLRVYCTNNIYGQSGVGNKTTQSVWTYLNINTNNLIDICDYVPKNGYSKKLLHGEITTLFVYDSGYTLGCGSNFETLDSDGNNINCFDDKYLSDNCSIKPVKTNIDNILKIQNETILYKNNLTNNSIINKNSNNYVKDFYSYCSPNTYGVYFLDKYGSLKCLVYGDDKTLNYYTNRRDYIKKTTSSYKLIDFNNFYNVRNWTLKDNTKHEFRMELYKNSEEYLCDIPKEYVEKIDYKLGLDINCFDITVPRYINGSIEENPLYSLIKSREQIIVTDINNIKSRFILKEGSGEFTKSSGSKTFKAYSMEKCVMNNTVQISEGYYTLNKDNEYEDSGIVDTVMKDTIYDIGCIDIEAKNREFVGYNTNSIDIVKPSDIYSTTKQTDFYCIKEDVKYSDTLYTYYNKMSQPKDKEEQGVWDSSGVNIGSSNSYGENPCYLTLIYNNVISGELNINADGSYYISNEIKYGTQIISIDNPITYELLNIKAIVNNEIGKRNSIKHIITYKANYSSQLLSFEQVDDFVKCATDSNTNNIKRYITWDSITLQYTKGDKTTVVDTVEFKYSDKEQSIDSFLTDISDTFTCTFEFDTINNFIHCFDGELKNLTNETGFTLGKTQIGDMALGEENAINMSKIIDKLNSDTNVELTYDDITKIESKDSDENIVSGLRIKGKDDTSIINYNPLGINIIENWDYFINNGLLSKSCEEHLYKYLSILETKKNEWNNIQKRYSELTQTIIGKETSLTIYKERIQELNAFLNTLLSENNNIDNKNIDDYKNSLSTYNDSYTNTKNEIDNLNSEKDKLEEELFNYSNSIKKLNILDENKNNVFTYSDIQELSYLQNIEEISDDYFTDGQQLYEYYKKQLEYKSKGLVEFTTTTNNMMRYYMYGGNLIRLGNIYELDNELKNVFKTNRVKLLQYSYYPNKYENGSIENLVFSNKEKVIDELKLFRKNTQIKTQNNEKEIYNLTSKITELESKINGKQDICYNQEAVNNRILNGDLIKSGEIIIDLTNLKFRPIDWSKYPEIDKDNLPYLEKEECSYIGDYIKKSVVHFTGTDGIKRIGYSKAGTLYGEHGGYFIEISYKEDIKYTDTPQDVLNLVSSIKITKKLFVKNDIKYIPVADGLFKDSSQFGYSKMPYTEMDDKNFDGALPIKRTATLESKKGTAYITYEDNPTPSEIEETRVEFVYIWNNTDGRWEVNNLNVKYYIFSYSDNCI